MRSFASATHGMGGRQCVRELASELQHALEWHFGVFFDDVVEILAFNEGHSDKARISNTPHIVNAQNVFVGNLTGEKELLLEAFQRIGLAHHSLANDLDGYCAVKLFIVSLVDAAHAALAEERIDAIAGAEFTARSKGSRVLHYDCFHIPNGHGGAAVAARVREVGIDAATVRAVHRRVRQAGSSLRGTSSELSCIAAAPATSKSNT
jgi:hypothetical protein